MKHSYFAQMGGFAIDSKDPAEEYIPGSPLVYLTANGAAILARQGRLPQVTEQFISDKSKANSLAKILVMIQAGWLIVECIGRAVAGLPITLLEINTMAHVVCALIMYALWWHKPLNISDPIVIKGDWVHPFCAVMWMFSEISSQTEHEFTRSPRTFERPEFQSLIRYENLQRRSSSLQEPFVNATSTTGDVETDAATCQQDLTLMTMLPDSHDAEINVNAIQRVNSQAALNITISEGQALLPMGFGPNSESLHTFAREMSRTKTVQAAPDHRVHIEVDKVRLKRWSLAAACLDSHPHLWAQHQRRLSNIRTQDGVLWTRTEFPDDLCKSNYVNIRVPNWPGNDLIWRNKGLAAGFFVACGTIYGGLHLAAWNEHFPSSAERLCWRISAIYLAGSAVLFSLASVYDGPFLALMGENGSAGKAWRGWRGCCIQWGIECVRTILGGVLSVCGMLYVCARCFLVVEAFISLRALPVEAYATPEWSQYLSHL